MRLIEALAASAALHLGMLALPAGELSLGEATSGGARREVLQAELRPAAKNPESPPSQSEFSSEAVAVQTDQPPESDSTQQATEVEPAAPGIPLPHYYGPREVEVRATPTRQIDLEPPGILGIPGQGKLILRLWINESGTVDRVDVESSEVADTLQKIIAEQFRQAVFTPAQLKGKPVRSFMKIEVVVRPPLPALRVTPPPPPNARPSSAGEN